MNWNVTLDCDEDGVWVVGCPAIPGCISQGRTREEALDNVREAIALCLEVRAEEGFSLTVETRQVEVPRLLAAVPVLSNAEAVRVFRSFAWSVVSQSESHFILTKLGSMMDTAWKEVMDALQSELPGPTFQKYLRHVRPLRLTSDLLTLWVPSEFVKDWLTRRFARRMEEILEEFLGRPIILAFQIASAKGGAARATTLSVPHHDPVARGTLRGLIRAVGLTTDDFVNAI